MNSGDIPTKNGIAYEDLCRNAATAAPASASAQSSNRLEDASESSSSGVDLRVLTLNVWGLPQPWPVGSKDRKYRLRKLAEAILKENYDIVGLQEVWSVNDYTDLIERLSGSFRFHHYFHSGFTGSGVCVFSRHRIVSTFTLRYSLNGFAHHIHRGDWFGGKVVGLVVVEIGGIRVNFYCTHLHAEYNRENDLYLPHRMAQSFELSQFVRHTAHGADVVIITGDFNMEPEDLGLRLIISQVHLVDAWRLAHPVSPQRLCNAYSSPCRGVENGSTCDRPDNCYSSRKFRQKDDSKRLDYILFKNGRMSLCLEMCDVVMNKILDEELNYSDHVGVLAHFIVNNKDRQPSCEWEPNRPLLVEAIAIVSAGQRRARSDRTWFMCGSALLFVTVIASLFLDDFAPFLSVILSVMRVILTLMIAFCVWYGLIGLTLERKALEAAKQAMQQLLND